MTGIEVGLQRMHVLNIPHTHLNQSAHGLDPTNTASHQEPVLAVQSCPKAQALLAGQKTRLRDRHRDI